MWRYQEFVRKRARRRLSALCATSRKKVGCQQATSHKDALPEHPDSPGKRRRAHRILWKMLQFTGNRGAPRRTGNEPSIGKEVLARTANSAQS